MRVVVDAFWWDSGPPSLRHVARELVLNWAAQFPQDELHLVVRRGADLAGMPEGVIPHPTRWWPQAFAIVLAGARISRRIGADAVVSHNFGVPPVLLGRHRRARSAVFIQDVLFVTDPHWFTTVERAYFRGMTVLAPRADLVLASTRSERARILASTAATRVEAVGLGLSSELQRAQPDPTVAERLRLGRFLLSVGRLNARKNLKNAILGAAASGVLSAELPLVIVGEGDGLAAELPEDIESLRERGIVRFVGRVTDEELRWLYTHCELFLFTSLGEGFGMPPVEALASGARVVVTDAEVFRETLGDLVTFVDAHDPGAIGAGIRAALVRAAPDDAREITLRHSWSRTTAAIRRQLVLEMAGSAGDRAPRDTEGHDDPEGA